MRAKSQKFETKQEVQDPLPGPEMLQKLLFVKSLKYVFRIFLPQTSLLGALFMVPGGVCARNCCCLKLDFVSSVVLIGACAHSYLTQSCNCFS